MLSKLVKKKEYFYICGEKYFNIFRNEYQNYVCTQMNVFGEQQSLKDKFIGLNVFEVTDYIYKNNNFYEYLKCAFIAKKYEKKVNLIQWIIILFFILIGIGFYFIFGITIKFFIAVIVLFLILMLIFKFLLKTGEPYKSYYNRTMLLFLLDVYHNLNFNMNGSNLVSDEELRLIIDKHYDKKKILNDMNFGGTFCSGNIFDLELIRIQEKRNKDGSVSKYDDKIFDGFCLKINTNNNFNMLRGNIIKIRSDENIMSSLAEDTVKGIYESQLDISFNSEEMNKSFDGKISGYNGFETVDDMMIQVQKILTPSFEQHLLYLRSRYNTFNMNITDSGMSVSVNMERSMFQKAKHNELLDFKRTYREANETFRMIKADVDGIEDFAYYNVFPFLERLYLINYLTYLYLSYMDFDNYYSLNSNNINSFEESMNNIYTMDNKDFREIYTDKIKEIKNNVKDYEKKLLEMEK